MNIKRFLLSIVVVIAAWTLIPTAWIVGSVVVLVAFLASILLEIVVGTATVAKNILIDTWKALNGLKGGAKRPAKIGFYLIDSWNALKELKGDAKRPAKISFYLMTAQFSKLQALPDEEKK